jgi:glucan biosynthesis protein C
MALLLFARRRLNTPGPELRLASRNAYVVYIFHAPLIVWIAYGWLRLQLRPAVKWVMLAAAGVVVTIVLGELVLKRIPEVRRVLS